jgi:DNA-binding NarL/FixJ family response regulator
MLKVLIVEDSRNFRQLLKCNLKDRFPLMAIEEASEGVEAMQKVDSRCPDLIFMDIGLPGENGLELTRKIRIKCPDVRVIILTSSDLPEYRETAKKHGAHHFMIKNSTTMEEIQDLVASISSEMGKPV